MALLKVIFQKGKCLFYGSVLFHRGSQGL